jgi:hypothetical protein
LNGRYYLAVPASIYCNREGVVGTCGKCLHPSAAVVAESPNAAWTALQALGWTLYKQGYALFPACTADPPNVDKDAARAMSGVWLRVGL